MADLFIRYFSIARNGDRRDYFSYSYRGISGDALLRGNRDIEILTDLIERHATIEEGGKKIKRILEVNFFDEIKSDFTRDRCRTLAQMINAHNMLALG